MRADDRALVDAAAKVADGAPVDWVSAESRADEGAVTDPAVADHLGVALHHAHGGPAACTTERADTRFDLGDSRRQVLVGNEANQLMFRVATTGQRGGAPGDGGQFDEVATVHGVKA